MNAVLTRRIVPTPRRSAMTFPSSRSAAASGGTQPPHLSTPGSVRKRGIVWLGAALLAAVLQADL